MPVTKTEPKLVAPIGTTIGATTGPETAVREKIYEGLTPQQLVDAYRFME